MTHFKFKVNTIGKTKVALAAVFLGSAVNIASAADLRITGIPEGTDLYETLAGGSLLVEQTADDADPSSQEVVAAAQADYGRLLAERDRSDLNLLAFRGFHHGII